MAGESQGKVVKEKQAWLEGSIELATGYRH